MIVVFASSLYTNDTQIELLRRVLGVSGKRFLFVNPLDPKDLSKIQLYSASGLTKLYFDGKRIVPTTFFHSRLWRTDCIIDIPDNVNYPTFFRQKANSFLEEIEFCFRGVKSFPGKYGDIRLGESKCAVYQVAHSCGLKVPEITVNSFSKPKNLSYKKVLGFPFSISLNREKGEEVAVTLLNGTEPDILGLPWQWQSEVQAQKHIRCVVVGKRIWTSSLSETYLKGRSLREAQDDGDIFVWDQDELPSEVATKLHKLLGKLGLEYAAPEFLIKPNGDHVFIDLNPCGDWYGFMNESESKKIAEEIVSRL